MTTGHKPPARCEAFDAGHRCTRDADHRGNCYFFDDNCVGYYKTVLPASYRMHLTEHEASVLNAIESNCNGSADIAAAADDGVDMTAGKKMTIKITNHYSAETAAALGASRDHVKDLILNVVRTRQREQKSSWLNQNIGCVTTDLETRYLCEHCCGRILTVPIHMNWLPTDDELAIHAFEHFKTCTATSARTPRVKQDESTTCSDGKHPLRLGESSSCQCGAVTTNLPARSVTVDPLDVEYDGVTLRQLLAGDRRERQEDSSVSRWRFTTAQRAAVSAHWSALLRAKIAAAAAQPTERVVLADLQDEP